LAGDALDAANISALVAALQGVSERRAGYVCVVAYVQGDREVVARGETTGRLLEVGRGHGGFGYDPLFLSDDLGVTFGEASPVEKGTVSHRGRAFRGLLEALAGLE
jgi:XTP/dITP diphosphohydrolase